MIDDTYDNLVLHSSGSVLKRCPALGETYNPQFEIWIPMQGGRPPAVAIRCESRDAAMHIMQSRISGSSYVITVLWSPIIPTGDNATLYWYAFYPVSRKSTGSGALIIRNRATGLVTFDSDLAYLRVRDVVADTVQKSVAYPGDRRYAVMLMRVQYYVETNNAYIGHMGTWRWSADWDIIGTNFNGNTLVLRNVWLRQADEGFPEEVGGIWRQDGYSFLVVDVTDL